jgi:molecular chaperone DnaK
VLIDFGGPRLTAPEVSARILSRLRQDAATALGLPLDEVRHAVVTVPAYFNVLQREATVLAGQLAGLEVVDLLNEPTAAALAYADSVLPPGAEQRILVFDLGGGTFDVSLLEATRDEDGYVFATRVVDGDTCLGGDDVDAALTRWLTEEIERKYGRSIPAGDGLTRDQLRRAAETAKIDGSALDEVLVDLPGLNPGGAEPLDVRLPVSRGQLELCAKDVVGRATAVARRAVEDVAGLKWTEIDAVILVGGQTRMPAVRRAVAELWGRPPLADERPQLVVALGAGEYAHNLSLGRERFHQNALINVLALPVGIRLDENAFEALVPANATVPYRSQPFAVTTTEDNQTQIRVEILQGPRGARRADECVLLGGVEMDVLPAPARTPKFEVRFDAQVDGTLLVEVNDLRSDRKEKTIIRPGGLAWKDQENRPTSPR